MKKYFVTLEIEEHAQLESIKKSGRMMIHDLLNARQISVFRSRVVFTSPTF